VNVPPNPNFKIRNQIVNGVFEYIIDAFFSKDSDSSRDGFITNYVFSIDGIIINSENAEITHVFEYESHKIGLRIQDNDELYSEQIKESIFVN
jgi:hypothetical protein